MTSLKAKYYLLESIHVDKEIQIDMNIDASEDSSITTLHLSSKFQFIQNYFSCLKNNETPFIINPSINSLDAKKFSNLAGASKLITSDESLSFTGGKRISLGHVTCSSGTTSSTGEIKKFQFNFEQIKQNAIAHYNSLNIHESKNILFPMPLYHSFGVVVGVLGSALLGHNLYTYETTPTNDVLIESLEKYNIDILYLTPSLIRILNKYLQRKKILINREIIISIGSAHLYKSDLVQLKASIPKSKIFYTYGLSEAGPRVSTYEIPQKLEEIDHYNDLLPIGSAVSEDVKLHIIDNQLHISSPFSFKNELINTADEVYVNENNQIFILGRKDFTINFGGINIYPEEIEAQLASKLSHYSFIVSGQKSALYGEVPVIVIETSKIDDSKAIKEIQEICTQTLGTHQNITNILFLDSFPRTSMGKIKRALIKELINLA